MNTSYVARACVVVLALAGAAWSTTTTAAEKGSEATAVALREAAERVLGAPVGPLRRPVSMTSSAASNEVSAEILGVIEQPFRHLVQAVADPEHWCAVLILHINNKGCRVAAIDGVPHIALKVARKYDQPVEQAYDLDFAYHVVEATGALLSVRLEAPTGPLGTRAYVIGLEAIPLGARTALRLSYAYRQGTMTGVAMDLYFSTIGRGKVGFTTLDQTPAGEPQFIGGVRGLVERNLVRYFLALEAAASHPEGTGPDIFGRRLRQWFDATEAYPRQLHEVDRATYLDIKRRLAPGS